VWSLIGISGGAGGWGFKPKKPFVRGVRGYFLEQHETRKVPYSLNRLSSSE